MKKPGGNPSSAIPGGGGSEQASAAAERAAESAGQVAEAYTDTIKPGDGITQTFMDYAQSNGKDISPARAFEIFNQAKDAGLLTEDNISNISTQGVTGGVGFNGTGSTQLSPEIIEFLNSQLESK